MLRSSRWTIVLVLYVAFGAGLLAYAVPERVYSEEGFIYDMIWLDAWGLAYVFLLVLLWRCGSSVPRRGLVMIAGTAIYGIVAIALVFAGGKFGENAYWGDQQFRLAMLTKFLSFWCPGDFYYKDLPAFYPPVFFWVLSLWGRLVGAQAFELLKMSYGATWLVMPFLLYWMWRRLVSPTTAAIVSIATLLIDAGSIQTLVNAPYAFISGCLFIPWWLYYVEQVGKARRPGWQHHLIGGIIGAVLFSVYFYPFFILALLVLYRLTVWLVRIRGSRTCAAPRGWITLGLAALLSSPYWLPVIVSVVQYGSDRSRGDWFHIETTGLAFPFLSFGWIGVFYLCGICYMLWRNRRAVSSGLLMLIGTILVYYMIGSALGALDLPLNIGKAKEFAWLPAGPVIGLMLADALRCGRRRKLLQAAAVGASVLLALLCVNGLSAYAKGSEYVKIARRTSVPSWGSRTAETDAMKGKVMLGTDTEFAAFHPVYTFIAGNEHYSHPASRFIQRYELLALLRRIDDPYVFHLVLRNNQFDAVDYVRPEIRDGHLGFWISVSNYPNRLISHNLTFSQSVLADTSLFQPLNVGGVYRVVPSVGAGRSIHWEEGNRSDSIRVLNDLLLLRSRLNAKGQELLDSYAEFARAGYRHMLSWPDSHRFGKSICLTDMSGFRVRDSVRLFMTFRADRIVPRDWRVSVHVYSTPGKAEFGNFDFSPPIPTSAWMPGDIVTLEQTVPFLGEQMAVVIGFFDGLDMEGQGFARQYAVMQ